MADVFISYSKSEIGLTRQLADYLQSLGISVWWDASLTSGEVFRDVIDRELDAAKAAIVIWTSSSVSSRWVQSEADHADRDRKLIPVRSTNLDMRRIPKPYNTLHTVLLDDYGAILAALGRFGIKRTVVEPFEAVTPKTEPIAQRLGFNFAVRASKGAKKDQEDSAVIRSGTVGLDASVDQVAAVLADGVSAKASGALASSIASEIFLRSFASSSGDVAARLDEGLKFANAAIAKRVKEEPALVGMATTLLGTSFGPAGIEWISVGDSPLFLVRQGEIVRINEDHSLAPEIEKLAAAGRMSWDDARSDPRRNYLRSFLSGGELDLIDRSRRPLPLEPNDVVILASDGIQTLAEADVERVVSGHVHEGPKIIGEELISKVEHARDPDQGNTTIIVVCKNS